MEAATIERRFYTYDEAERFTGLHRVSLWRAVRDGKLRASGAGRGIRFDVRELEAFMAARGHAQGRG